MSQQTLHQFPKEVEELLLQTLHFANFLASPPINATTESQYLMNEIDYVSRKVLKTLDKHQNNNNGASSSPTASSSANITTTTTTKTNVSKSQVTTTVVVEENNNKLAQQPQSPSLMNVEQIQQQKSLRIITDAIKTAREKAIQTIIESKKLSAVQSGIVLASFLDDVEVKQEKSKNDVDQIFINNSSSSQNQNQNNSNSNDDWWVNNNNDNNKNSLALPAFPSFPANINRSITQQIQDARKANNKNTSPSTIVATSNKPPGITFSNYSGRQQQNQQQQSNNINTFSFQNLPQQLQNNPTAKNFLENFSSQLKDMASNNQLQSSEAKGTGVNNNANFMNSFMNTMMAMMNNNNSNSNSNSTITTTNLLGLPRPPNVTPGNNSNNNNIQRNVYQRPNVIGLPVPTTFSFSEDVAAGTTKSPEFSGSAIGHQHHQAIRRDREEGKDGEKE